MTDQSRLQLTDALIEKMLAQRAGPGAPADLVPAIAAAIDSTGQRAPGVLGTLRGPAGSRTRRGPGRTWLLAAAALLLVGGAMAAGSGLVRLPSLVPPVPAPTLPVAVTNPTGAPESLAPSEAPSAVPYRAASWTATGNMVLGLAGGTATLLRDGRVLVAGGSAWVTPPDSAEVYDPGTESWSTTGRMVTPREGGTATLLPDGRVLVVGGSGDGSGTQILASAELYDPSTGSWTATAGMHEVRTGHSATLLPNGKVLVAGGYNGKSNADHPSLASAELYDPETGSWTATGTMTARRAGAPAALLRDGRVLVVGGQDYGADTLASAEVYDPDTGSWTATGSMHEVRALHMLTLLLDGRVLVAGGVDNVIDTGASVTAELYDPGTGSWTNTGSMGAPRMFAMSALLPDGRVLVAGGRGGYDGPDLGQAAAELYDPVSGSWAATASMICSGSSATLLRDGRVLVGCGKAGSPAGTPSPAELYDPGSGSAPASSTPGSPSPSPSASASGTPDPTLGACADPGTPASSVAGAPGWTFTRDMTTLRRQNTATLLLDGRVLVTGGGASRRVGLTLVPPGTAELYDPTTRVWTATGSMVTAREGNTATLLPDGRVLVAGGTEPIVDKVLRSAELYDPRSGTWTATGSMVTGRGSHTATLMPDGKVLVTGGFGVGIGNVLTSAELYDPRTGTWTKTGRMVTPRVYHKATLLADGRVLVTSGINDGPEGGPTVADLYDPGTGTWTTTRKLVSPGQGDSATLLPDGHVLVAGGADGTTAQLYDPRDGSWTRTGSMVTHRRYHTATLLADGTVLVTGGEYETTPACTSTELFDPKSGSWAAAPHMLVLRDNYTATLLADGTVLVAGGAGDGEAATAELYDPGSR